MIIMVFLFLSNTIEMQNPVYSLFWGEEQRNRGLRGGVIFSVTQNVSGG